jgi:hypothetical protein
MIDGIDSDYPDKYPSMPLIFITTNVNNHQMKIMIDTGANHSFINERCLKFNNQFKYLNVHHQKFFMADGITTFKVTGIVQLNITIADTITTIDAFVANNLCTDIILGMDYLLKYDLEIQPKKKSIIFNFNDKKIVISMDEEITPIHFPVKLSRSICIPPNSEQQIPVNVNLSSAILTFRPSFKFVQYTSLYTPHSLLNIKKYSTSITVINSSKYPCHLSKGLIVGIGTYNNSGYYQNNDNGVPAMFNSFYSSFQQLNTITTPSSFITTQQSILNLIQHITDDNQSARIRSLLFKFQNTFDTSQYKTAKTKIFHAIETCPHPPPVSKCYPGTPSSNAEMKLIIDKLLEADLIRQSQSPYAAPALLTKKKDQTWRLVVDYKKLNAITIKDNHPLPNMEVTLQTLGGGYKYFSKLDLKSGFWQLPIDKKDRHKTAFTTPFGLYEWNVLPQGLRNAPPSFQRIMNNILSSCTYFCLVYLDDIVIFSRTYDEHLFHLEQVLNALQLHNLTLNPPKCQLAKQTIEYLGHVITSTTITPLPDKIQSILLLPEPKTLAQANRFIGAL